MNTRGGRRAGAGRKKAGTPPLRHTTISLDTETLEILRQLGDGSISAGVREAVRLATEARRQKDE